MVLLICTVSLVSIPFSVIAAEKNVHTNVAVEQIMPRYGNISQISGNIQAVSGKINCSVDENINLNKRQNEPSKEKWKFLEYGKKLE